SGSPSSATRPMLMLVALVHVFTARKISCCHALVGAVALSDWNKTLGAPSTIVPSGTKLSFKCCASGHGTPNVDGTSRASSCSTANVSRRFIDCLPLAGRPSGEGFGPVCFALRLKPVPREARRLHCLLQPEPSFEL